MALIRLSEVAVQLPQAWSSNVLAQFGEGRLKLLRMDARAYPEECHDYAEGLLVLDREMVLEIESRTQRVRRRRDLSRTCGRAAQRG